MVQMEDLKQRRDAWERKGSPPCEHRRREKEYYLGAQTGDTGCLDCGEDFPPAEERALRAR